MTSLKRQLQIESGCGATCINLMLQWAERMRDLIETEQANPETIPSKNETKEDNIETILKKIETIVRENQPTESP